MAYEPLHHKYRPQTFAGLVGQEAIATTLSNAIAAQKIAPAYMFTGPRGTGKTSSARILAKSLNCINSDVPTATPCGQCEVCQSIARGSALDVIEIDAASNTGVDNIREIIERAQFAPVQCRYKVYVIDECHMLSTAAFNALLKTLEEPPARVVFVLATTDPQRVLTTIISRCQRFDFRRIPLDSMVKHLSAIADKESIEITDEAITLVAQIANGGLRDAESLLDQLSLLAGKVTIERVWDLVGAVSERELLTLLQAIRRGETEATIENCRSLMDRGREPLAVLQSLAGFYVNLSIAKTAPQRQDLVAVTEATWKALCEEADSWSMDRIFHSQKHLKDSESQLRHSTQARLWLEVTLLGLLPNAIASSSAVTAPQTASTATVPTHNLMGNVTQKEAAPQTAPTATTPPQTQVNHSVTPKSSPHQAQRQFQATEPPQESESTPVTSQTAVSENRIHQTWQSVLQCLSSTSVSDTWIKQHCQLVDLDLEAGVAHIRVLENGHLEIAQRWQYKIEQSFEQIFYEKIRIQFRLGNSIVTSYKSSKSRDRGSVTPSSSSVKSKASVTSPPAESRPTSSPKQHHNPPSSVVSTSPVTSPPHHTPSQNDHTPPKMIEKPVVESSAATAIASSAMSETKGETQASDTLPATVEEMDKAVQHLVKLFDGEAIDFSDQ